MKTLFSCVFLDLNLLLWSKQLLFITLLFTSSDFLHPIIYLFTLVKNITSTGTFSVKYKVNNVIITISVSFSPFLAVVVPDGASEKAGVGDDLGSEEDLLYEEFRGSGHRFGHPGGGGGEQLAINEVGNEETLSHCPT